MPGEDPADQGLHLVLLGQEAAGRVGDRHGIVADLERGDGADVQPDALVGDALLGDLRLAQGEGEHAGPLLDRHDEASVPGDDPELRRVLVPLGTRNEQRLVRGRYVPEQHGDLPFPGFAGVFGVGRGRLRSVLGVTSTDRADSASTTTTLECRGIGSSDHAANASLPPRTSSSTSPGPFAGMDTVTRPIAPIRLSAAPPLASTATSPAFALCARIGIPPLFSGPAATPPVFNGPVPITPLGSYEIRHSLECLLTAWHSHRKGARLDGGHERVGAPSSSRIVNVADGTARCTAPGDVTFEAINASGAAVLQEYQHYGARDRAFHYPAGNALRLCPPRS